MDLSELDAYLGDFADQLDHNTKSDLLEASDAIEDRYPDDDPANADAFTGAVACAFGDETLDTLADKWKAARAAEREAMAQLTGAIIWTDIHDRLSQVAISERAGINRQTIRKALGL